MGSPAFKVIKQAGRLPSPKGVALELMRLLDAPGSSIKQITSVVEADPALSSRLLKLVNSPLAGVSRTIASLAMAVNLLGRPAVRNLVLGMSLIESDKDVLTEKFSFESFWSESLARAASARHLARFLGGCIPDEAFTVALMSRIGCLGLAFTFPDRYDALLAETEGLSDSDRLKAEQETFGIDQNELSSEMMSEWFMPEVYCDAVRRQGAVDAASLGKDPNAAKSRTKRAISLLQLADAFASTLVKDGIYGEDLAGLLSVGASFGLDSGAVTVAFDGAKEEWRAIGAVFSVGTAEVVPSLREVHSRASRDQRSILVVDDDPMILMLFEKQLTDAGYVVTTAANGQEALRAIHAEGFQLVVTDCHMPVMDGLQLCSALRGSDGIGLVYVIVVTGDTDARTLEYAFENGADDFLNKPWEEFELLARLKAGVRALRLEAKLAAEQRAVHRTNAELAVLNDRLGQMAITDELTGLHNRREARARLEEYWAMARRKNEPLACMAFDIDLFKRFNDDYGHDAGDTVLRETAHVLQTALRSSESVFRMGGEEFLVLCPLSTAEMAADGAERIRKTIESHRITHRELELQVRVSAGVAQIDDSMRNCEDLLKLADQALYEAKAAGRNRVVISPNALATTA